MPPFALLSCACAACNRSCCFCTCSCNRASDLLARFASASPARPATVCSTWSRFATASRHRSSALRSASFWYFTFHVAHCHCGFSTTVGAGSGPVIRNSQDSPRMARTCGCDGAGAGAGACACDCAGPCACFIVSVCVAVVILVFLLSVWDWNALSTPRRARGLPVPPTQCSWLNFHFQRDGKHCSQFLPVLRAECFQFGSKLKQALPRKLAEVAQRSGRKRQGLELFKEHGFFCVHSFRFLLSFELECLEHSDIPKWGYRKAHGQPCFFLSITSSNDRGIIVGTALLAPNELEMCTTFDSAMTLACTANSPPWGSWSGTSARPLSTASSMLFSIFNNACLSARLFAPRILV